ncbi:MAG: hypothetical protein ABIH49_02325 [archaeon]
MLEVLLDYNWALFFHIAGMIIGLGAVTVIDTLGFISRKSKYNTETTIRAHHVTKPLIWIGTIIALISWIFLFDFSSIAYWKSFILLALILNGGFLSFYISPRLDKLLGKNKLLPKELQNKIMLSFIVSFTGWWSFVFLTVLMIG